MNPLSTLDLDLNAHSGVPRVAATRVAATRFPNQATHPIAFVFQRIL